MKVRKLLELQSTIEERKVPCDMGENLNQHYSESKEDYVDILDMDLIHLVRSYSKCIGQGYLDVRKLDKKTIIYNLDSILAKIKNISRELD
jgi:hypothetical protein